MESFLLSLLSKVLANILPAFIPRLWDEYVIRRLLKRPPRAVLREIDLFLEILFPEAPPKVEAGKCLYLPDSQHFFGLKVDVLDSLERDALGHTSIMCRVPWLIMPDDYRDIYLSSAEARTYYAMLERQARLGKLKYLYNLNSLKRSQLPAAIRRGSELHSYPMLLRSTFFDVMIAHTDRYRHTVVFATRPIGTKDEEIGVAVQQLDLYSRFRSLFDEAWEEARSYWIIQEQHEVPLLVLNEMHPLFMPDQQLSLE